MSKETLNHHIADFNFLHTRIICDKLSDNGFLFSINLWKRYSLSYCWDSDRQLFMQGKGSFLTYTRNSKQHQNIVVIKSTLKIPPRQNGVIQIKIKGHNFSDHVAYFISNQHIKKGLDPNIHVTDGIYYIKGKLSLHIIVANYTNQHDTFNKGQYIDHMEPSIASMPQTSVNSIITQKMMGKFQPDTFKPPFT